MDNLITLCADSSATLSVALQVGDNLYEETVSGEMRHGELLLPITQSLLSRAKISTLQVTHLGVTSGPGSFTGVRTAATIFKTIAWSNQIPLYSYNTLDVLASSALSLPFVIVPIIDAKKSSLFTAIYYDNKRVSDIMDIKAELLFELLASDLETRYELPQGKQIFLIGDGILPYKEQIGKRNFLTATQTHSVVRASIICQKLRDDIMKNDETHLVNALSFSPQYHREADASLSPKKGN